MDKILGEVDNESIYCRICQCGLKCNRRFRDALSVKAAKSIQHHRVGIDNFFPDELSDELFFLGRNVPPRIPFSNAAVLHNGRDPVSVKKDVLQFHRNSGCFL